MTSKALGKRRMTRLRLFAAALLTTTLPLASASPALAQSGPVASAQPETPPRIERRPNVILILADDIGAEAINAYGGQFYTPRIDELSRRGVRLDNAHATPLCTPSRVRIMTGQESHRNYRAFGYLDPKEPTFGNLFRDAGYTTGIFGKWQLSGNGFDGRVGANPQQAGFQTSLLWQQEVLKKRGSRYYGPTVSENGVPRTLESGFGPDVINDRVLQFISDNRDQPFFLYYPMMLPHDPFVATPDMPGAQGDQEKFSAMVSYMDKLVGSVVDQVRKLGLEQDTLILFTGDNGTSPKIDRYINGRRFDGGKGQPTIGGTRVPFVASWPGKLPQGEVREAIFDFADVLPTIARASGLELDTKHYDGVDQFDVWTGKSPAARDWIFMHFAPGWIAKPERLIFDATHKLYGDGRFVSMDKETGVETNLSSGKAGTAASRRKREFETLLRNMNDGPLNLDRFPMCKDEPSLDPALPSIQAGCNRVKNRGADL